MVARRMTRRRLIGTTAAAGAVLVTGQVGRAQGVAGKGGIGLSRQQFDSVYGSGTEAGDLFTYPNPYLDGSYLSVAFQNDAATFIQAFVPQRADFPQTDASAMAQKLMPPDATPVASWLIPTQESSGLQYWFQDFDAASLRSSGSETSRVQRCILRAGVQGDVTGITISLAIPGGADQFTPTEGSVGVGDTIRAWGNVHGQPRDTGAAAGNYSGQYDIRPWDSMLVRSNRGEGDEVAISLIDATSQGGVAEDDAIAFGNSILPQGAQRQAAFEALPTEDGPQGWGTSTWQLSDGLPILLFSLGAGDGSGNVIRVAATKAQSTG